MNMRERLAALGVAVPTVLLPAKNVDYSRFAVVACDQFTSNPAYWKRVSDFTGELPSALHIILPELYLEEIPDLPTAIADINGIMASYLQENILENLGDCFIYLERETSTGLRKGLMVALDLEQYDYTGCGDALICATEKTVVERLPSRIAIRKNAPLEMPHAMVLVDDADHLLLGPLATYAQGKKPLYDFPLMENGGRLTGWRVSDEDALLGVAAALEDLHKSCPMLFAVGDGNHSLAAAKECWKEIKAGLTPEEQCTHPARYVLAELVNLHDPALMMEPIHRVVFGVDKAAFLADLGLDLENLPSLQELQPRLDAWLLSHPAAKLDYIHGAEEAYAFGQEPCNVALVWKEFDKNTLFSTVLTKGVLVRKSFSMGEARDKRYYLECRRIV